jgi:hypothetical protein
MNSDKLERMIRELHEVYGHDLNTKDDKVRAFFKDMARKLEVPFDDFLEACNALAQKLQHEDWEMQQLDELMHKRTGRGKIIQ